MPRPRFKAWPWSILLVVFALGTWPLLGILSKLWSADTNLLETLTRSETLDALTGTLILSFGATLVALLIGTPLAWLVARTDLPARGWLRSLLTIPYVIPPYIAAVAWMNLANPDVGWINQWIGKGTIDIYSMAGMTWVLGLSFYPFVYLTVQAALENADPALEEAARMSGAGLGRVFWQIQIPMLKPALASSAGLVFMASASAFGVPALLGSPARISVLTTRIYERLIDGSGLASASELALPLFGLALIPLLLRPARHAFLGGKASAAVRLPLGRARFPLTGLVWLFVAIGILLPALAVTVTAFMRVAGNFSTENFTLDHFRSLAQEDTAQAMKNSSLLAIGTASLAVLLGGVAAYLQIKTRHAARKPLGLFLSLPLATPGTVLALGLILVWSTPIPLTNTIWILVVAYLAKYLALASRAIGEGLGSVDDVLADAARMSGASGLLLARTIWLPLVLPAVVAGWFLVFMPTFSELTMSVLLVGPGLETVGTRMFYLQDYGGPTAASVLATVVLGLVIGFNLILRVSTRGRYGI